MRRLLAAGAIPATGALQYLAGQQKADGSIDGAVGETLDFVLGAAGAGYDPRTLRSSGGKTPFDWLSAGIASATADPNRAGKLVQALVAGRLDPTSFAGHNVLHDLQAYYQSTTGAYISNPSDSNDPCLASANGAECQANSILGLVAANNAGYPVPVKALAYLKSLQASSGTSQGAWGSYSPGDTNATAMALMALVADGDTPGNDAATFSSAFSFLHSQQDPASGGFPYAAAFGTASDPDSDALVIQALLAARQDPGSAAWSNSKGSPVSDLATFRQASGAYSFDHTACSSTSSSCTFTTTEVPGALARTAFPVVLGYLDGASLASAPCVAAATPGPTPSAAPAPVGLPRAGRPAGRPGDARDSMFFGLAGFVGLAGLGGIGWAARRWRAA